MAISNQTLGERLKAARNNLNLTQDAVAEQLGIPRTSVLQIEAGNRSVSTMELQQFAHIFGKTIGDLLAISPVEDDPVILFRSILGEETWGESGKEIRDSIRLLHEATELQGFLGDRNRAAPPSYQFPDPVNFSEAVNQGREMANLERHRLNLGFAPVADMAELIATQAIWAVAVQMPQEVSGFFLHNRACGMSIFVNQDHSQARRRFSYAHEYAHALVDRNKSAKPSSSANRNELVEKRANAFAAEFLVPEGGTREMLDLLQKGAPTRESVHLYDPTTDDAEAHLSRLEPGSQTITVKEVALLASQFKVSFDMAAFRLSDIKIINREELEKLRAQREFGRILMDTLNLWNGDKQGDDQPYLKRQLALLAIEAYRREKITGGRFREVCRLAGYKSNDLLKVVEAGAGG